MVKELQVAVKETNQALKDSIVECFKAVRKVLYAQPNKPAYRGVLPRNKRRW